ncbi:MAG: hypothetical protein WAN75_28510, partial [Xanthobacteraceae bacterium]
MVTKNSGIVSLTILSCITFIGAPVQSAQPERPINSVREIRASLRACWISPAVTKAPPATYRSIEPEAKRRNSRAAADQ